METFVGFYFKKISEKLEKRANEVPVRRDITYTQSKILWYLRTHEKEKVLMRDLEKYFDCSHATIFGILKRLQEKGYVLLEQDEEDKRAKKVCRTEKAKERFRDIKNRRNRTEELLLEGFTDEEKKDFSAFLDRVYENLGGCDGEEKGKRTKREQKEQK
jgi:DNA-binding MarR family transcriptional regulator